MHHHNAPALSSQLAQYFLDKHQIPQVPQPPYSLDIAACDFFSIPRGENAVEGE
jgi:hypothetical protein